MMQTEKTKQVVRQFLQHLTHRNLSGLVKLFSEEIDWYIPGNQQRAVWLGRRKNREDIGAFYELL
ncbi:nuclear transport factor 2 family protein [Rapidithrix thailandica]|uniref:Nuclear transport factor 2 family protein n=1 Tax=Rapidithrix thailandica TaxID=413964 RepID=A0AAW9SKS1_9BACT